MADVYDLHSDLISDQHTGSPDFLEPVSEGFAESNEDGYAEWMAPDEDSADEASDVSYGAQADAPLPVADYTHDTGPRPLSEDEQADLNQLQNVMSGGAGGALMAAGGRGAYIHHDDEPDVDEESAPALEATTGLPPARTPWWKFGWFDGRKRSHRLMAVGAVGAVGILTVALLPGGSDKSPKNTTPTTPAFTVPTMTQSASSTAAPAPGAPGADGPIGIKRADSRCTAGSTDPMQAFNRHSGSAWMCVPAYLPSSAGSDTPVGTAVVLRVEFDNWYVVTGVSMVPGWNRINPDGSDEWIKHLTVATVEYQFNDPDETRLTQETNNIRGPVLTPVTPPVLASAMTITITQLGKPTGQVANTTTIPGQGATLGSDTPKSGDLKDFAVSAIDIVGHRAS